MVWMVIIAAATLLLDLLAKHLSTMHLGNGALTAIPGLLTLRLTHNDGIALGLMSGNQIALLVLPVVIVLCGWLMLRKYHITTYTRIACGLILGGFLGNYLERLLQGYVVDMLYFPFLPWFVCNVADVAVCFGVVLLVISLLFRPQDWREKNAEDREESDH